MELTSSMDEEQLIIDNGQWTIVELTSSMDEEQLIIDNGQWTIVELTSSMDFELSGDKFFVYSLKDDSEFY